MAINLQSAPQHFRDMEDGHKDRKGISELKAEKKSRQTSTSKGQRAVKDFVTINGPADVGSTVSVSMALA